MNRVVKIKIVHLRHNYVWGGGSSQCFWHTKRGDSFIWHTKGGDSLTGEWG